MFLPRLNWVYVILKTYTVLQAKHECWQVKKNTISCNARKKLYTKISSTFYDLPSMQRKTCSHIRRKQRKDYNKYLVCVIILRFNIFYLVTNRTLKSFKTITENSYYNLYFHIIMIGSFWTNTRRRGLLPVENTYKSECIQISDVL